MTEQTQHNPETMAMPELTVAQKEQVATLGSAFHEQWCQTRLNDQGEYEPRVKYTTDMSWVE